MEGNPQTEEEKRIEEALRIEEAKAKRKELIARYPHATAYLEKLPAGFVPHPSSPLFDPPLPPDAHEPIPVAYHDNEWIPKTCHHCKYLGRVNMPTDFGNINIYACEHPDSLRHKGGMNAVLFDDPPNEHCPFVVMEEAYKNKPIRRWFLRLWLRLKRRMNPMGQSKQERGV